MGACSYYFIVNGKLDSKECNQALRDQQENDREENGHQDGYSGDSQTVGKVVLHTVNFENENDALDYCMDNSEKWHYFIAVYLNDKKTFIGGWAAC